MWFSSATRASALTFCKILCWFQVTDSGSSPTERPPPRLLAHGEHECQKRRGYPEGWLQLGHSMTWKAPEWVRLRPLLLKIINCRSERCGNTSLANQRKPQWEAEIMSVIAETFLRCRLCSYRPVFSSGVACLKEKHCTEYKCQSMNMAGAVRTTTVSSQDNSIINCRRGSLLCLWFVTLKA